MSTVDSNIPLSGQQVQMPDFLGMATQAENLKGKKLAIDEAQQGQKERYQLKELYSQGGYGKPGFEQKLGAIAPEQVPEYQKTLLEAENTHAKIGETKALEAKHVYDLAKAKNTDALEAVSTEYEVYQDALKKFGPEKAAQIAEVEHQRQMMLARNEKDANGNPLYSPQEIAKFGGSHFDPRASEAAYMKLLGVKGMMEMQDKDREQTEKERHNRAVEKNAGATGFTPEMGDLMGSLAEQGVTLPAGFRSKSQQSTLLKGLIDRNPDKTPDEIAQLVKSGQLSFGASKTEASVLGRREAAILPVEKSIIKPGGFLDQAEKAVNDVDLPTLKAAGAFETWGKDQESDPKLTTYKAAIAELRAEYALVLSKGGQVTDAARHESAKVIPDLITKEQFKSVRKIVTQGIEASKSGVEESLSGVTGNKSSTKTVHWDDL